MTGIWTAFQNNSSKFFTFYSLVSMNSLNFRRLKGIPEWLGREVSGNCLQSTKRGCRWIWQVERRTRRTDSRTRINRLEKWPNSYFKWFARILNSFWTIRGVTHRIESIYIFQFVLQLPLLISITLIISFNRKEIKRIFEQQKCIKIFENLKS